MEITTLDPQPRSYGMGALATGASNILFISGQVPEDETGHVPETFDDQCRLAWRNVVGVLNTAHLGLENLTKVTVFLSDRQYREANARIRHEVLGGHSPALTVIITGIYDEKWLLEIEAVAVS
ncbi:RidA family protein [Cryptosporangium aurantiacum]|uniref:RidA family protein n=1 Tax=Cryptosporangium aurantiacum TaxID=134849 RepID=UPI001C4A5E6B|nr:RidA family protein [Cryptosporangium aurantiacum]